MLIKKPADLRYSEITPKSVYLTAASSSLKVPAAVLAARELLSPSHGQAGTKLPNLAKSPLSTDEKQNTFDQVTHYNNYYEFGTQKDQPAKYAQNFTWTPGPSRWKAR